VGYLLVPGVPVDGLWAFVAVLVVAFTLGSRTGTPGWPVLALLLVLGVEAHDLLAAPHEVDAGNPLLSGLAVVGAPLLAGMIVGHARRQTAELQRLSEALASEREAHVRAVVLGERNRIAGEIHEVISRAVSSMVVEAGAAAQLLPADAPARAALAVVRDTGRDALTELHEQLGVLDPDASTERPWLPTWADLRSAVDAAGAELTAEPVDLELLPDGTAMTAYRILQEALTNARKHAAGARVQVTVRREEGLDIDVRNGPGNRLDVSGAGLGLLGMRERVASYAGRLDAGPTPDGGWRVHVWLPLEQAAELEGART
jgi:signal transduction histidine kinase